MDRRLDDVLQRRAVREQVEVLEHHADVAALLGGVTGRHLVQLVAPLAVADQIAVDIQPARIDLLEMVDAAQERRLARARRADHAQHLALADLQRDALEHLQGAEALADLLGLHHRLSCVVTCPASPICCALASASSCLVVSLRDAPRE